MKLYIVCNARIPNKKAFGIQVAKMCEAFIEAGNEVQLVVPRTSAFTTNPSVQEFYHLRTPVPTVALPALDWYGTNFVGFVLSALNFMITSTFYLLGERMRGSKGVVYAVDMDSFSSLTLSLSDLPVFIEIDKMPAARLLSRPLLKRMCGVVAINTEVAKDLMHGYRMPQEKILAAPNGVDPEWFTDITKEDARKKLGLPMDARIAMYVGRFYQWKGLEILPMVCEQLPDVTFVVVGGTAEEFSKVTGCAVPKNMQLVGLKPSEEVPLWQRAADVLLVLGTQKNKDSFKYTAPMKIFEYMTSGRPIVAAKTPAVQSIVEEGAVLWYEPDTATSLAEQTRRALEGDKDIEAMVECAKHLAQQHTWSARAKSIADFITARINVY